LAPVKRRPDALVPAGLVWRFTLPDQLRRHQPDPVRRVGFSGHSLNVAVAGSLVLYNLAGLT
jgi:hypothetical protein